MGFGPEVSEIRDLYNLQYRKATGKKKMPKEPPKVRRPQARKISELNLDLIQAQINM